MSHLAVDAGASVAEQHEEPRKGADLEVSGAVAPGAMSALLAALAHAPTRPIDDGGRPWPLPGTVVGRFALQHELGRGGFGVVYQARDRELGRSVAFKLVRPGQLEREGSQLGREAEVIARLCHPNLVTLFDVGHCEFGPFLVLELLRGTTLERRLQQGPLPLREALRVGLEVARGLAHAHAEGVVHRDLKPSNVFLCQDGQVKLLDFGMAHAFGRRRRDGGTPGYMAPEQWRGAPEDERTDVFALGVMLHQLVAGELPFPSDDDGREVVSARPAPALIVPEAPGLPALVARMLEKDPTRRPRDGGAVAAALAPHAASPQADVPPPARRVRRLRRPGRAALAAAIAGTVLAVAAVMALVRPPPRPARPRTVAVRPFVSMTSAEGGDYFSAGLTEEVCHLLTRLRELRVSCGRAGDAPPAAGADVVLGGSVRRDQERLRIGVELVDAGNFRLWSQIYDRRLEDVFAIQGDIARSVVGALELILSRASESELASAPPANPAAYDLYLRARAELRKPASDAPLGEATRLFEQALAADPRLAQAQAGLCDAWLARYLLGRSPESYARAEDACRAALARGRATPELHLALGNLHLLAGRLDEAGQDFARARDSGFDPVEPLLGLARVAAARGQADEAERLFLQARALDPDDWRVHQQLGNFLFERGRHAEAARAYADVVARTPENTMAWGAMGGALYLAGEFEKAAEAHEHSLRLSPSRVAYSNVGTSYYYLGRFEEAVAMYRKAQALAPGDYQMWGNLADALAQLPGRADEAQAAYQRALALGEAKLRVNPTDADVLSDLALYQAALRRPERARALDAEARRRDPGSMYVHYAAALVAIRLGEDEAALGELERAVALGYQPQLVAADPELARLHASARFAALVASRPPVAPAATTTTGGGR